MDPIITSVIFVAGLFLGVLINIIVIRLPREQHMGGWPDCTGCGKPLAIWQILPVIGWLAQGGKARCCGKRLGWIFPLNELLFGLTLALLYVRYGLTTPFFYLAFVAAILIITGAIDWLHRSIYTFVILGAALAAVIVSSIIPGHSLPNALLGTFVAGFLFAIFFVLARVLFPAKAAPFGLGDVYLGMFLGAAFGFTRLLPVMFYGMILAGIFSILLIAARSAGRRDVPEYISYGTFLCLGALGFLLSRGF